MTEEQAIGREALPNSPYEAIAGHFNVERLCREIISAEMQDKIPVFYADSVMVASDIEAEDLSRVLILLAEHDPDASPEVDSVSAAQAKTALFNARLDDEVDAIVAAHPYKPVRIFYSSANDWLKANPYVRAIAVELGLLTIDETGAEIDNGLDELYRAASKL